MSYVVEEELPQGWLISLGLYVQTCAYIEYYVSQSICIMEGLSENTDEWDQRFNKLRSFRTAQLIKALEKRAKSLEDNSKWKSYFRELAEYLEQSKDDRHRAVHGRHFFDGSNVNIDMANRPSQFTEVPPSLAGEAISNADRILRNLMQFCREAAKN